MTAMPQKILDIGSEHFYYIDLRTAEVLYRVCADGCEVYAIGHGGNGSYEWVVCGEEKITFSNVGYGNAGVALRDGLDEAIV